MLSIAAIVAVSSNHVIGKNNQLPWSLPADLKYFKSLTLSHAVLMGRKTYESIGKPLPQRTNIILSRHLTLQAPGCTVLPTMEAAIALARHNHHKHLFVIGGAEIFQYCLPWIETLYLTRVHCVVEGNCYWPVECLDGWQLITEEHHQADTANEYDYSFLVFKLGKMCRRSL